MATWNIGRLGFAFWLVLVLSALGGLGLLSKHYRKTDEGPIPPGPFAVQSEAWTSLGESSAKVDGVTVIERRLIAPHGALPAAIVDHLEVEHQRFRDAAPDKTLRILVYDDATSPGSDLRWLARSEQSPDAASPTIEVSSAP